MTTENLTKKQRENILKAKKIIQFRNKSFDWDLTKEGSDYWDKVYEALDRIANSKPKGTKKCKFCGGIIE